MSDVAPHDLMIFKFNMKQYDEKYHAVYIDGGYAITNYGETTPITDVYDTIAEAYWELCYTNRGNIKFPLQLW